MVKRRGHSKSLTKSNALLKNKINIKETKNTKDLSNTFVAVILAASIILSVVGTIIVMESISSAEKTVQLIHHEESGKISLSLDNEPKIISESTFGQGKLRLEVKQLKKK